MKGNWKAFFLLLFVAALVVATIWGLVNLIGLQASLIWTAIIGAMGWAVQSSVRQKQEYQRLLAEQKRLQYFEFLDFLNEFASASLESPESTSPERLLQLRRWSLRLTMIGSDEVVKAWNQAKGVGLIDTNRQRADDQETRTLAILSAWGGLWLAMRKDCGHFDTKLTVFDMLASFVNDIESYRSRL